MTLRDLLDGLNMYVDEDVSNDEALDAEIQVHFHPSYPLRGDLRNVRMLGDKLVFAAGEGYEYGSKKAWTDESEEEDAE